MSRTTRVSYRRTKCPHQRRWGQWLPREDIFRNSKLPALRHPIVPVCDRFRRLLVHSYAPELRHGHAECPALPFDLHLHLAQRIRRVLVVEHPDDGHAFTHFQRRRAVFPNALRHKRAAPASCTTPWRSAPSTGSPRDSAGASKGKEEAFALSESPEPLFSRAGRRKKKPSVRRATGATARRHQPRPP